MFRDNSLVYKVARVSHIMLTPTSIYCFGISSFKRVGRIRLQRRLVDSIYIEISHKKNYQNFQNLIYRNKNLQYGDNYSTIAKRITEQFRISNIKEHNFKKIVEFVMKFYNLDSKYQFEEKLILDETDKNYLRMSFRIKECCCDNE